MPIEPYVFFSGQAEQALAFYQEALGATVESVMRFSESPDPYPEGALSAEQARMIMHASFRVGGARVMVSDGGAMTGRPLSGFALSLQYDTESDARRAFAALSQQGHVDLPIGPTFWSPCYGMVTDRFGVQWMVTVADELGP